LRAGDGSNQNNGVRRARARGAFEFLRARGLGYKTVRTERYKYIKYNTLKDMNELYDLKTDSYGLDNLFTKPKANRILKNPQAELDRLDKAIKITYI